MDKNLEWNYKNTSRLVRHISLHERDNRKCKERDSAFRLAVSPFCAFVVCQFLLLSHYGATLASSLIKDLQGIYSELTVSYMSLVKVNLKSVNSENEKSTNFGFGSWPKHTAESVQ